MLQKTPHLFCLGPQIFFGELVEEGDDDEEIPEWDLFKKTQHQLPPTGLFLYWPETIE